jgi:hypothetical protein
MNVSTAQLPQTQCRQPGSPDGEGEAGGHPHYRESPRPHVTLAGLLRHYQVSSRQRGWRSATDPRGWKMTGTPATVARTLAAGRLHG